MKRLAVAALMLMTACDQNPSKLGGSKGGGTASTGAATEGGDEANAELDAAIGRIEARISAIEAAQKLRFGSDGKTEAPMAERLQRVEGSLVRYGEALEFLYKYYLQQKAQQEAQEANEPDPTAVFAVNIEPALRAGQVDGSSSALVTIVEAWDFA
jgi:hypothetical protein